jgi:hypothetical protein
VAGRLTAQGRSRREQVRLALGVDLRCTWAVSAGPGPAQPPHGGGLRNRFPFHPRRGHGRGRLRLARGRAFDCCGARHVAPSGSVFVIPPYEVHTGEPAVRIGLGYRVATSGPGGCSTCRPTPALAARVMAGIRTRSCVFALPQALGPRCHRRCAYSQHHEHGNGRNGRLDHQQRGRQGSCHLGHADRRAQWCSPRYPREQQASEQLPASRGRHQEAVSARAETSPMARCGRNTSSAPSPTLNKANMMVVSRSTGLMTARRTTARKPMLPGALGWARGRRSPAGLSWCTDHKLRAITR